MREPTSSNYDCGHSTVKAVRSSSLTSNRRRLLDLGSFPARQQQYSQSKASPTSRITGTRPSAPNLSSPPRPAFDQRTTDSQQGMKVLFLIDHATKGDALHHNISPLLIRSTSSPSSSSIPKRLMSKYRSDRSSFQNHFFAKARLIRSQLTSRRDFLDLFLMSYDDDTTDSQARRLAYFDQKCTTAHLSTLYHRIASAVDIPRILAARSPHKKAFKKADSAGIRAQHGRRPVELRTPPRQAGSSRTAREGGQKGGVRCFKELTNRVHGLPGYTDVPLTADFPQYVLFGRGARPRDEGDVYGSGEEGGGEDEGERGDMMPHPWIPAEV